MKPIYLSFSPESKKAENNLVSNLLFDKLESKIFPFRSKNIDNILNKTKSLGHKMVIHFKLKVNIFFSWSSAPFNGHP